MKESCLKILIQKKRQMKWNDLNGLKLHGKVHRTTQKIEKYCYFLHVRFKFEVPFVQIRTPSLHDFFVI